MSKKVNENNEINKEKVEGIDMPQVTDLKKMLKEYLKWFCYSYVYYMQFNEDGELTKKRENKNNLKHKIDNMIKEKKDVEKEKKIKAKNELNEMEEKYLKLKKEKLKEFDFNSHIKDLIGNNKWNEYIDNSEENFSKYGSDEENLILGKVKRYDIGSYNFEIHVPSGVKSITEGTCYMNIERYNIVMHKKMSSNGEFPFDGFTFKFYDKNYSNLKTEIEKEFKNSIKKEDYISFVDLFDDKDDKITNFFKAYFKVYDDHLLTESIIYLEKNRNLILHGAPGTGKTHLSKEIAKRIINLTTKKDGKSVTVQFHPSYDYTDFIEGLRPTKNGNQIVFERKDGHFKAFCKEAAKDENKDENYVFIIDEINRGEISKIFGEIFSLIEKDYRGEDNKIATQYQGLIDDKKDKKDIFKKGFYIPDNVYIIGTMNDIDKGVDSIDFAIRRRFIWKEIKAKDTQDSILNSKFDKLNEEIEECKDEKIKQYKDCLPEIKKRMDALNEVIAKDPELGTDYQIGAAYFKNITIDDNGPNYDELWETALEPLLKEYLRGRGDFDIEKFKKAYELKNDNNSKKRKDKSQPNPEADTPIEDEDSNNEE